MTWSKREATSNLVVLGDDEGQVRGASGLLASIRQDAQYPSRSNYELVQRNGESITLAGSASLGRQLFPGDVGKFVRCKFIGWGKSPNGKFKMIEVNVYEGEASAEMKAWPRYAEIQKSLARAATRAIQAPKTTDSDDSGAPPLDEGDFPPSEDDDDNDFPF